MSVTELSDHCDAAPSTVYRRLEPLLDCGLEAERTRPHDGGHHHSVYAARLRSLTVTLSDGAFGVRTTNVDDAGEDVADLFTDLWEGLDG